MSELKSEASQLLLVFPDSYADTSIDQVVTSFDLPEALVKVKKVPQETYAAFEWTVPTLFAVYLGQKVFEAMLGEVVKDLTPKVLAGLKVFAIRCKEMDIKFLSASQSTQKLSRNYHQSAGFSIVAQTKSGQRIKLLFDEKLSQTDWEDAIDGFVVTVAANYVNYPDDQLTKSAVAQATKPTATLYSVYNRDANGWEIHNDQTMLLHQQSQASKPQE